MEVSLGAAFLAGVLMFLAPCTLPIVPGYLAFISGGGSRRAVVINAIAFVLGFSIIFILLGTFAATIGSFLCPWRDTLGRVGGAIIIIFGLTMLGVLRVSVLQSERRFAIPHFLTIGRPESSFLIGILFALGWSPCIGPILGSILLLASDSSTALQGALLLGVFSLGLGLPFIATAFMLERTGKLFAGSGKVAWALQMVGGVLLVVLGILMLTGNMALLLDVGFSILKEPYESLLQYM
jgi:cytochrome c-type biogenesis protein